MEETLTNINTLMSTSPDFKDSDIKDEFIALSLEFFTEIAGTVFGLNSSQYTIDTDKESCAVHLRLPLLHLRLRPLPDNDTKKSLGTRSILSYCAASSGQEEALQGVYNYVNITNYPEVKASMGSMVQLYRKVHNFMMQVRR